MNDIEKEDIRSAVRQNYAKVAITENSGCGCSSEGCCGGGAGGSILLGYSQKELSAVPEGADLGLGCGNPQAIAALKTAEVVLDLGSGAGFDVFLAARQVGESGQVIGVDMTPEMIAKATANAVKGGYTNVEFRLGQIEDLPVDSESVDVIISNCVINLSPDKAQVFAEAYRVLKPGGRLAVSDVVAFAELPEAAKKDMAAYSGCFSGASMISEVQQMLQAAGFQDVSITAIDGSQSFMRDWIPGMNISEYVLSAQLQAVKPH